jgi:HSP20 family protein
MAEPQTATPQEKTGAGNGPSQKITESERRTFQESRKDQDAQTGRTAEKAGEAARGLARATTEAGRGLAEQTRRGVGEVGDFWRQTMDPFMALNMDVSRMFDDFWRQAAGFGAVPSLRTARPFGALSAAPLAGLPATDVKETDQAYELSIELAGLDREDVDITLRGDALQVCGHKTEEKTETNTAWRMSERRFGRFERSFPLPPDVDRARIKATFRNGLLTIDLPKAEESQAQRSRIPIT